MKTNKFEPILNYLLAVLISLILTGFLLAWFDIL